MPKFFKMKKANAFLFNFLIVLFFSSCTTARYATTEKAEIVFFENFKSENDFFDFETIQSNKFIFLRLLDVYYRQEYANQEILNKAISVLGPAKNGIVYDHASISHKISDDFVGVSSNYFKNAAQIESIQHSSQNNFLERNDREKSTCTLIAIPCSFVEYENCKTLLDYALSGEKNIFYDTLSITGIPLINKTNKQKLEDFEYSDFSSFKGETQTIIRPIKNPEIVFESYNYICSSFCAFVLYNSLQSFRNICEQTKVNIKGITPSELLCLPNSKILFSCPYDEYEKSLKTFLQQHPQFEEYL